MKKDNICPNAFTQGVHFRASAAAQDLDLFPALKDKNAFRRNGSTYEVLINGNKTDYKINCISFEAGDDVLIKCTRGKFPMLSAKDAPIAEILEPLPQMFVYNPEHGNVPATDFSYMFARCCDLKAVPDYLFANNTAVESFSQCFHYCISLSGIPANLFSGLTAELDAKDFSYCFVACESLTVIPEKLFNDNKNITTVSGCFASCDSLTAIPENLFANCRAITDFSNCFRRCKSLTAIPENLFANNVQAESFAYCFYNCTSLRADTETLFRNQPDADFKKCFCGVKMGKQSKKEQGPGIIPSCFAPYPAGDDREFDYHAVEKNVINGVFVPPCENIQECALDIFSRIPWSLQILLTALLKK